MIIPQLNRFLPPKQKNPLELILKALRTSLSPQLNLVAVLATKEETDRKTIVSYALQLVSNKVCDKKVSIVCKEIICSGTFFNTLSEMPYPSLFTY